MTKQNVQNDDNLVKELSLLSNKESWQIVVMEYTLNEVAVAVSFATGSIRSFLLRQIKKNFSIEEIAGVVSKLKNAKSLAFLFDKIILFDESNDCGTRRYKANVIFSEAVPDDMKLHLFITSKEKEALLEAYGKCKIMSLLKNNSEFAEFFIVVLNKCYECWEKHIVKFISDRILVEVFKAADCNGRLFDLLSSRQQSIIIGAGLK